MDSEVEIANASLAAAINEAAEVMWRRFDMSGEGMLLSEWTVSAAFLDENGDTVFASFSPPHLPEHHRVGLLHEALDW